MKLKDEELKALNRIVILVRELSPEGRRWLQDRLSRGELRDEYNDLLRARYV
jgi:hypothetical protein